MGKSLGSAFFIHGDSDVLHLSALGEEGCEVIALGPEAKVANEHGGGGTVVATSATGTWGTSISGSRLLGRQVNLEASAVEVRSMLSSNGLLGLGGSGEFDKGNTLALTLEGGDLHVNDGTVFLESLLDGVLVALEGQVAHKDLFGLG